tara:strand:- start:3374 stop:4132 length:759 start_codon:yes stop_codon:yes gene_type:complete
MKKKIRSFWNSRAKNKLFAGSNTVLPDLLETDYLIKLIKKNKSVLDVGCGNGIFLERLKKKTNFKSALGFDYSKQMIKEAKKRQIKKTQFIALDMTDNKSLQLLNHKFDYIITKRSLINLANFKQQVKVLDKLSKLLKKNGRILSCENSLTNLKNINKARKKVGLKKIIPPWHNVYIENTRLINYKFKYIKFVNLHEFSSSFYFVTRVINALNSKLKKNNKFDDNINQIGYSLEQNLIPGYSQNVVFEFLKK